MPIKLVVSKKNATFRVVIRMTTLKTSEKDNQAAGFAKLVLELCRYHQVEGQSATAQGTHSNLCVRELVDQTVWTAQR